jgi:hypothetical protein
MLKILKMKSKKIFSLSLLLIFSINQLCAKQSFAEQPEITFNRNTKTRHSDKVKCMVKEKAGMDSPAAIILKEKIHSEVAFLLIKWDEPQAQEFVDDISCFRPVDKGDFIGEWTSGIKHKRSAEWTKLINKLKTLPEYKNKLLQLKNHL